MLEIDAKSRMATGATVAVPALGYENARAAVEWLITAFGAEARTVIPGPGESIGHAEVWINEACVMLGSLTATPTPPTIRGQSAVYVAMRRDADVDAMHARATAHAARVVKPLQDTPYGSHEFGVLDVEGNYWAFGTYVPK